MGNFNNHAAKLNQTYLSFQHSAHSFLEILVVWLLQFLPHEVFGNSRLPHASNNFIMAIRGIHLLKNNYNDENIDFIN